MRKSILVVTIIFNMAILGNQQAKAELPICTEPDAQYSPAIYGDIVVWYDYRDGETDIYGYNFSTAQEFAICTALGSQSSPDIYGDIVVWSDRRNGKG